MREEHGDRPGVGTARPRVGSTAGRVANDDKEPGAARGKKLPASRRRCRATRGGKQSGWECGPIDRSIPTGPLRDRQQVRAGEAGRQAPANSDGRASISVQQTTASSTDDPRTGPTGREAERLGGHPTGGRRDIDELHSRMERPHTRAIQTGGAARQRCVWGACVVLCGQRKQCTHLASAPHSAARTPSYPSTTCSSSPRQRQRQHQRHRSARQPCQPKRPRARTPSRGLTPSPMRSSSP